MAKSEHLVVSWKASDAKTPGIISYGTLRYRSNEAIQSKKHFKVEYEHEEYILYKKKGRKYIRATYEEFWHLEDVKAWVGYQYDEINTGDRL